MQLQFFPSRTISLYMAKMFLTRTFSVLGGLVVILMTLDLLGESGKVVPQQVIGPMRGSEHGDNEKKGEKMSHAGGRGWS